jgi:hypothetical protein
VEDDDRLEVVLLDAVRRGENERDERPQGVDPKRRLGDQVLHQAGDDEAHLGDGVAVPGNVLQDGQRESCVAGRRRQEQLHEELEDPVLGQNEAADALRWIVAVDFGLQVSEKPEKDEDVKILCWIVDFVEFYFSLNLGF